MYIGVCGCFASACGSIASRRRSIASACRSIASVDVGVMILEHRSTVLNNSLKILWFTLVLLPLQSIMPNGKNDIVRLKSQKLLRSKAELDALPKGKLLVNTINAFSYNNAKKDEAFAMALVNGDVLIPDGMSVVKACQWLGNPDAPKERVAGWDLFMHEMRKLNTLKPLETSIHHERKRVLFFGSSEKVLNIIKERARKDFPNLEVVTYSPPYKKEFSTEESKAMVDFINDADPDLMWVGMTAPKQEKWTYQHWGEMNVKCHVGTVGAVFDFYAGTTKRAPLWWQQHGIEWLYRLMKEPRRMWKRYIIGNVEFLWYVIGERLNG